MNFMGALRGIGTGFKHAGGALKKTLDDPERMAKIGRVAQSFGKGAQGVNPDSQIGRAVGGAGRGMQHRAAQRLTPPELGDEQVQLAQMPAPPMEPPPGFGAPMEAPYMPPDVEMDEQGNYRRKGGIPLQY